MYQTINKFTRYNCTRCNTYFETETKPDVCPVCKHRSSDFVRRVGPIKRLFQNIIGYRRG